MHVKKFKQYLLTGTSHMIPFIVAGGIIFSLSVMLSGKPAAPTEGFYGALATIGGAGLTLFVPVLAGYIAYAIADKPALAPAMIGGYLSNEVGAGFLGAIFAGFLGGFVVYYLKKIKLPTSMKSLGTIFLYPLVGTLIVGLASLMSPKKYNDEEKEAGKAAILMGCVGITEGAIPFASNDPLRVIPSIMCGSIVGTVIAFLSGCLNHAPWGGIIVLPVVEGQLMYVVSIIIGAIVTAIMVNTLKKPAVETEIKEVEEIELNFEQF